MKVRLMLLVLVALIVGVFVVIAVKVKTKSASKAAVAVDAKAREAAANVKAPPKIVAPQPGPTTEMLHVGGTLRPEAEVDLAFKLPGRVVEIPVKKGDLVQAGDLLARIDPRDVEAQAEQLKAGMQAARAQESMAADALRRSKNLVAAGAATEQQVFMAGGQANLTTAQMAQLEAQGKGVDLMKQETKLTAPISGIVVRAPSAAGFFAPPGQPYFRIERLTTLKFTANVADRDASRLKTGVTIDLETDAGVKAVGVIDLLIPSADPMTRRVPLEASVPNPDGKLIAGSYVEGQVMVAAPANVAIPSTALLTGDSAAVLVVIEGKLVRRPVTLLRSDKENLYVTAGLALTDYVVANPGASWREGDVLPAGAVMPAVAVSPTN
jgi:RND family efflux transporter MFP subunit